MYFALPRMANKFNIHRADKKNMCVYTIKKEKNHEKNK